MAAFTRKLQAAKLDAKGVEKLLVLCKSVDGLFRGASKIKPTVQPLHRIARQNKIAALVAFVDI